MFLQNVSIAIVGEDMEFVVNEDSDVDKYLELIAGEEQVSEEIKWINANTKHGIIQRYA